MTIAIMTDIHGNLEAFEACIADAERQGAKAAALLGDVVGYGADPEAVVARAQAWLGPHGLAVKGNHDAAASGDERLLESMSEDAAVAMRWTRAALSQHAKAWLVALPMTARRGGALYVHADPRRPEAWSYVADSGDAERALRSVADRIVFSGHLHVSTLWQMHDQRPPQPFAPVPAQPVPLLPSRRWLAVIGAVGQPRDGDPRACYALHDPAAGRLTLRRVAYDVDGAAAKIRRAGLPPRLADRLLRGR